MKLTEYLQKNREILRVGTAVELNAAREDLEKGLRIIEGLVVLASMHGAGAGAERVAEGILNERSRP